jgi:protein MpaA
MMRFAWAPLTAAFLHAGLAQAGGNAPKKMPEAPAPVVAPAEKAPEKELSAESASNKELSDLCFKTLSKLPGKNDAKALRESCNTAKQLPECHSVKGVPVYHVNRDADPSEQKVRKILVFALIHGDEFPAGSVARSWMERLTSITPRNQWRVVPVLNPDGLKNKTRYNANGVDVNRNFPTNDWDANAKKYWISKTKSDRRRFPGHKSNSEPETQCAIAQIEDYRPDLILSIHTPYGVLDFDGPKIDPPKFAKLPWRGLGNYPGSLGRYMWVDRSRPTLTIELQPNGVVEKLQEFDRLQDISGDIAIKAEAILGTRPEDLPETPEAKFQNQKKVEEKADEPLPPTAPAKKAK